MKTKKKNIVQERFTDLKKHPATAFSGNKARLTHGIKNKNWLKSQPAYTLFKPAPHKQGKYQRQRVVAGGIDEQWQADLADMGNYARENGGYRYILMVIDVFSRYGFARPVKHKTGEEVARALESIYHKSQRHPKFYLQSDEGKEFFNRPMAQLARKYGYSQFHTYDRDIKAGIAERFVRTLKEMIWRYFTYTNTRKWVTHSKSRDKSSDKSNNKSSDLLGLFVNAYNHRYHRTLGMSPLQAMREDENDLFNILYPSHSEYQQKKIARDLDKIKVGDFVVINTAKKLFDRGVAPKWTREVYKVSDVDVRTPRASYKLQDIEGEDIEGWFVREQLQKVQDPSDQPLYVEKVLKYSDKQHPGQVFVKWLGWGSKFNSWVDKSKLKDT